MMAVRTLQDTFYEFHSQEAPSLDPSTGIMKNLPIWRAPHVQLPGRADMLIVRDGQYTHVFEQLLRGPEPWYFGHILFAGNSDVIRNHPLVTYFDDENERLCDDDALACGAHVGCLMQVRDYRRLVDGGFVLYVQAIERFVIEQVIQSLPYPMAHVQILPDISTPTVLQGESEQSASTRRAKRVRASFRFHDYEFADTKLPFPKSQYIDENMEVGMDLMRILSYSLYSQDEGMLKQTVMDDHYNKDYEKNQDGKECPTLSLLELSLEYHLLAFHVLKEPSKVERSADESEHLIWLGLEDYSHSLQVPLPEQVLCLKPPEFRYLNVPDAAHPVSCLYPKARRQTRLSYAIVGILNKKKDMLEISSTAARLENVLSQLNEKKQVIGGKFQ